MREDKAGMQLFTRQVGRESNWQVDDLDLQMSTVISETVGSLKLAFGEMIENVGRDCRAGVELFEAVSVWWMFSILALKNVMKLSHCAAVSRWGGKASAGFRILLMVENRALVFPSAVLIKVE